VNLQIRSITGSNCISKVTRPRPRGISLSSLDHHFQAHCELLSSTASSQSRYSVCRWVAMLIHRYIDTYMRIQTEYMTVVRGAPRVVVGVPRLVVGSPKLVVGAPRLVVGAPRLVVGAPSYSEGRQECPPRVWYSPEIDTSKFTLHILSDTPGGFQWLKYIVLMLCNRTRVILRHRVQGSIRGVRAVQNTRVFLTETRVVADVTYIPQQGWCSIDNHFHDRAGCMLLSFWPIQAANTFSIH